MSKFRQFHLVFLLPQRNVFKLITFYLILIFALFSETNVLVIKIVLTYSGNSVLSKFSLFALTAEVWICSHGFLRLLIFVVIRCVKVVDFFHLLFGAKILFKPICQIV
jgi:hypothetical protein